MIYAIIASFIILDILSGLTKAIYQKNLQSKIMREGLLHKFSYVIVLSLAYLIDYAQGYLGINFAPNTFELTSIFVCTTETVSIIENILAVLPDNVGTGLRDIFKTNKGDENDSNEGH